MWYNESNNEYVMEYMDYTLDRYISQNNSELTIAQRKNIGQQILRAFNYIHSKGRLHRDISPKNILLKKYDDTMLEDLRYIDYLLLKNGIDEYRRWVLWQWKTILLWRKLTIF